MTLFPSPAALAALAVLAFLSIAAGVQRPGEGVQFHSAPVADRLAGAVLRLLPGDEGR